MSKRGKTKKNKTQRNKKWTSALVAAQASLKKTGSLSKARMALRNQAAHNARKLFGSI